MENKINAIEVENHLLKTSLEIIYNRNLDMDTVKDISGMVLLNGSLRRTVDVHAHDQTVTISKKAFTPMENLITKVNKMEIPSNAQLLAAELAHKYGFETAILTSDAKYKTIARNIFKNLNEAQKTLTLLLDKKIVRGISGDVKNGVRAFYFPEEF